MTLVRNPELERALIADPRDRETFRVYADWLQQHGDVRGELIARELALEADPHNRKLALVTENYRARHFGGLLGELGPRLGLEPSGAVEWHRGFLWQVRVDELYIREPLADVVAAVLAHPCAILLAGISLLARDGAAIAAAVELLAAAPPTLRSVSIDADTDVGALAGLRSLALLETLRICVPLASWFVRRAPISTATLETLAGSSWPLRVLELHLTGEVMPDLLAATLREHPLPHLEQLHLHARGRGPGFASALLRAIADGPLPPQLLDLVLDLDLSRADYRLLVERRARFTRVRRIDVPSRTFQTRLNGSRG